MNWIINLYAKRTAIWATVTDLLPLLGGLGGALGALGAICARASVAKSPTDLFAALHPTTQEAVEISLAIGLIKQHFKHEEAQKA